MGKLKNAVLDLEISNETLKDFKISVMNKINFKRESINMEFEDNEMHYGESAVEAYSTMFEFPALLVVEVLSELGYSKDTLTIKTREEYSGPHLLGSYMYYEVDEVWDFIEGLEGKDFLITVLLISSSNSDWQSITSITQLIIKELYNYKIKINHRNPTVFIAMSFGNKMQNARETIVRVIKEYGYEAVLIDMKEHNNQIVPEIFNEIENSSFVVGDLTEQKRGVYLEVGYAMAKDKQVILTVKKEDFNENHFDVSQINTIIWDAEIELERRLRSRIKAMHLQNF
ncbi:hypothetical protein [Planococcus maitriensis]|uniref:CD-NTase-associated protein 12/Pycsar effector protein TIR domain-containing protein n=1 Tax=Planococcus maitriensis TaxID=221799 RepID=A0A365K3P7_9BACL|nr:hypothetical protein [Planococcus maitriensis]RAZ67273.1 hypothetical protein DP119_10940 [Planococcus maitriensis]